MKDDQGKAPTVGARRTSSVRSSSADSPPPAGVPNIGPAGVRLRRLVGIVAGAAGLALVTVLAVSGAPRPWRLTAFVPFWLGSLGWLQARERT